MQDANPKKIAIGSRWLNRYTGQTFEVVTIHGLKVETKDVKTGAPSPWHRSSLLSCNTQLP